MFNGDLKEAALRELRAAERTYQRLVSNVTEQSERLCTLRQNSSVEVIGAVERYINSLANTPKSFDRSFRLYQAEFKTFSAMIHSLQSEASDVELKAGSGAVVGVAAGVGVASFAPTAAMAIATTFGTASTGTAISALSGAAATKAALAWLGGGALAAGGGGVAAGKALLALAGPIGWAIGGSALLGGALYARSKNRELAEAANTQRKTVEAHSAALQVAAHEIEALLAATERHAAGVMALLEQLVVNAPADYRHFSDKQKEWLGALINHLHALGALLNKKVEA